MAVVHRDGDTLRAICNGCKMVVSATFRFRDVTTSTRSDYILLLVGVCDQCDEVISIPHQSVPSIKRTLKGRKHPHLLTLPPESFQALTSGSRRAIWQPCKTYRIGDTIRFLEGTEPSRVLWAEVSDIEPVQNGHCVISLSNMRLRSWWPIDRIYGEERAFELSCKLHVAVDKHISDMSYTVSREDLGIFGYSKESSLRALKGFFEMFDTQWSALVEAAESELSGDSKYVRRCLRTLVTDVSVVSPPHAARSMSAKYCHHCGKTRPWYMRIPFVQVCSYGCWREEGDK